MGHDGMYNGYRHGCTAPAFHSVCNSSFENDIGIKEMGADLFK